MSKTKQRLWTKFGDKEFFARMAENAKNDADGNEITQTYATKDVATTSADGLMSSADKTKLNGLETGAEVNAIESISANGTALSPDPNKNVDIPLATSESAGLIPSAEFGRIPGIPDPRAGEDQVFSYDSDNSASWQPITKGYVGNVMLDEQTGEPVLDEEGDGTPIYDEESAELWTAYKGTEFGARRAYEDHTGANIHDSLEAKVDKVTGAAGKLPAFDAGGNLVDSGVPLESKPAADGGTDLSLVTTGEKYVWNNTRQLPDPTGHVNGSVLSLMSSTVQWDGDDLDDFVTFNFPEGVEVGGKLYKAMQIGNQIWMAENLDYRPAGFTEDIISGNVAAAYYQGHPEWGLLYNRAAAFWLRDNPSSLPSGWRVATETDFSTLITYIKNDRGQGTTDYNVGTYLKSVRGWTTANGSDLYGFNGIASGWYRAYQYIGGGSLAMYMTSTPFKTDSSLATVVYLEDSGRVNITNGTVWCGGSIRLVKDAPMEE